MLSEKNLHMGLEGLGLSRYESRAYLTLVSMGTTSASELAYYAEIPRPKVYPTLLKLEKKKLVVITKTKPLSCIAISPEEAFDGIIQDQIHKVDAMNSLVSELKRIGEESKKTRGSGEDRYFSFSARSVLTGLRGSIQKARISVWAAVDRSGLSLVSECRGELLSALKRNISVRIIIPPDLANSDLLRSIPGGTETRTADMSQNYIIFDNAEAFVMDSDTGQGAIFPSDVLISGQKRMFNQAWEDAADIACLVGMNRNRIQEICSMIKLVRNDALRYMLDSAVSRQSKGLLDMLEANGILLRTKTLGEMVEMMDSALNMTCRGGVTLDAGKSTIVVESGEGAGRSIPWVVVLEEYLKGSGHKIRMAYKENPQGEKTYIRIQ